MGKQIQPRRMRYKDADVIVLEPEEFARLDALRRQAGAQSGQLSAMRGQLNKATELIDAIAAAAEDLPEDHPVRALLATRRK